MTLIRYIILFSVLLASAGCSVSPPIWLKECPVVEEKLCPAPKVVERVVVKEVPAELPPMASTAGKMHFPIIGAVEWVTVEPPGLLYEARIDTGAETTSIHAEKIKLVEKDGKRYVRYQLIDPATGVEIDMESRLRRSVLIKQNTGESERRYVVEMWVSLGDTRARIDVNLSDRKDFEYPLLLGRNFLTDTAIVDVSRHHTASQ